jgi:hypothetical protein
MSEADEVAQSLFPAFLQYLDKRGGYSHRRVQEFVSIELAASQSYTLVNAVEARLEQLYFS